MLDFQLRYTLYVLEKQWDVNKYKNNIVIKFISFSKFVILKKKIRYTQSYKKLQ